MPQNTRNDPYFRSAALEFAAVWAAIYILSIWAFNANAEEDGGQKQFVTLDDEDNFVHNSKYKGFSAEHLEWMWTSKHLDVWEPVAWFLKALVWYFFDLDASRWRDVQIFSHASGGALLFLLCRRVLGQLITPDRKQQTIACALGAAFWTLHPLRAEAVGWISCISYNFGVNFVVGSMLCYHIYLTASNNAARIVAYLSAAVLFFLALACKTPTISTLFGFLFIDAIVKPQRLLPPQRWLRPFGAVTDKLLFVAFAVFCLKMAAPGDDPCENPRTPGVCLSVKDRFIRACWALGFYVRMTLWPSQHMPHYALEIGDEPLRFDVAEYILPCVWLPLTTLIAVYVFLRELGKLSIKSAAKDTTKVKKAKKESKQEDPANSKPTFTRSFVISGAWVFFITWSLPAIGIVQHGVLTMGADRYHYLPALISAPVVALIVVQLPRSVAVSKPVQVGFVAFVIAMLIILSRAASKPWTNTVSLYTNAQRFRGTNTGFALNNFGYWYYRLEDWPKAVELFKQALMQEPDNIKGIINLADIYQYHEQDLEKAVDLYQEFVEYNPRSGSLVNNMISLYARLGRSDMAEYHHWLVPMLQFDWTEDNDGTLAWVFREHEQISKHNVLPNAGDERSPIQQELNASCWQKPAQWPSRGNVLNCLPSFVLIGAPRSGSTTLFNNLKSHPQLLLWDAWEDKELNYLNWVAKYPRHYAEALPALAPGLNAVTGEASVRYFMHPQAPRRLYETAPNAKLVVSVRNPILRAFSHWRMEKHLMNGREKHATFQEAVLEEMKRGLDDPSCLDAEMANGKFNYCYRDFKRLNYRHSVEAVPLNPYLAISIYHHQLWRWLQYFPIEQFVFLSFEDMEGDADGVQSNIDAITDHIGISRMDIRDEFGRVNITNQNFKGRDEVLSAKVLRGLKQFFQPHNERFYEMVGRDFGWEKQIDDMIRKQMQQSQKSHGSQQQRPPPAAYGGLQRNRPSSKYRQRQA